MVMDSKLLVSKGFLNVIDDVYEMCELYTLEGIFGEFWTPIFKKKKKKKKQLKLAKIHNKTLILDEIQLCCKNGGKLFNSFG